MFHLFFPRFPLVFFAFSFFFGVGLQASGYFAQDFGLQVWGERKSAHLLPARQTEATPPPAHALPLPAVQDTGQ